jgi:hypothetical protein
MGVLGMFKRQNQFQAAQQPPKGNFKSSQLIYLVLRVLQVVVGLAVIGFYAQDIQAANKKDIRTIQPRWVRETAPDGTLISFPPQISRLIFFLQIFAVSTGATGAVVSTVFAFVASLRRKTYCFKGGMTSIASWYYIDVIMAIAYLCLSVIFGTMYFSEEVEMVSGIYRMKVAAGFDMAGLVLYSCSVLSVTWYLKRKRGKSPRHPHDLESSEWHDNPLAVPTKAVRKGGLLRNLM